MAADRPRIESPSDATTTTGHASTCLDATGTAAAWAAVDRSRDTCRPYRRSRETLASARCLSFAIDRHTQPACRSAEHRRRTNTEPDRRDHEAYRRRKPTA